MANLHSRMEAKDVGCMGLNPYILFFYAKKTGALVR